MILIPLAIGAVIDAVSYAATSDHPTVEGAAGEVAQGAVLSLLPWGKLGKAAKLVRAAGRLVSRAGGRVTRVASAVGRWARPSVVVRAHTSGRLAPNLEALGPHSTFRRDPMGRVSHYATWKPQTNPRNPAPWTLHKRVDMTGEGHFNRALQTRIPTPHVQSRRIPGGVRPAMRWEIPHGW